MKMRKLIASIFLFSLIATMFAFLVGCDKDKTDNFVEDKVNGTDILNCNKTSYFNGEEIYVSAKGESDAWVALYREKDDINTAEFIRRYDINKNGFIGGNTYAFKKISQVNQSRPAFKDIPNGNYKFVLFKDAGKNVVSTVQFKVMADKIKQPSAPKQIIYDLKNTNDGLADGTLKLKFDKNSYAEEVILYWADNNGILNEYTSLAPFFATKNNMVFEMYANTIIPPNATKLRAYSKNSLGISSNYCEVNLPSNSMIDFGSNLLYEFQVVSDIHIAVEDTNCTQTYTKELHKEHLQKMCNDILLNSPNSQGIFVVGDIANSGRRSEWELASELLGAFENLPKVYYSLGNHDLYGSESYDFLVQNFYEFAETDSVYYEREIGGYHHLFLGSESKKSSVDADLSQTQLDWFDNKLNEITTADPNKPVFVYLHQSLYDTIAGSFPGQDWDGVIQDTELKNIIKKYKQIVMFNGHSHWDMNTRGSMHDTSDGLPNIFNTAAVGYLWTSYYQPKGEYLDGAQGYYIKVYSDKIMVLGRDFTTGKWIPSANFVIKR